MAMVVAGVIGGVAAIAGGIFGSSAAKKREAEARKERKRLQRKLDQLENSRQAIINPYSGAENLSSLAIDLSDKISNPFANLGVATQAAEIKIEEQQKQQAELAEARRQQGIQISEGQRMQGLDAAGKQFMFSTREGREVAQLDRTASILGASRQAEAQAGMDKTAAITGMLGSISGIAGGMAGG